MIKISYVMPVKPLQKASFRRHWLIDRNSTNLERNVNRLLGQSVLNPANITRTYKAKFEDFPNWVTWVRLIRVSRISWVLAVSLELKNDEKRKARDLRKLKHPLWQKTFGNLLSIQNESSVNSVAGSVSFEKIVESGTSLDGWLHIVPSNEKDGFISYMVRELAIRVAIERSILSWATSRQKSMIRLIQAPWSGYIVRRWQVQLLVENSEINDAYQRTRLSLNLDKVRIEVLERAKSWWSLSVALLSVFGLMLAVWQL